MDDLRGLLCVGDPHVAARAPGFRKDDYAQAVLEKLRWCVAYAREHRLLVVLLGDLFHHPRDISNALLVELISLFAADEVRGATYAVAGNHDCRENSLTRDDTLSVLAAAGAIRLLDKGPVRGTMNGCEVVVGGTCWGQPLPKEFDRSAVTPPGPRRPMWVFWITHHDVRFPGYEDTGRFGCREIPGIDAVINGHIHRQLPDVTIGATTWMNPGNICRVSRGDATRQHVPCALRIDVAPDGWRTTRVEVPHQPFDDVFHPEVGAEEVAPSGESLFVKQLAALEAYRTASGAGLESFLDANLGQFEPPVADEIRLLAKEVLPRG